MSWVRGARRRGKLPPVVVRREQERLRRAFAAALVAVLPAAAIAQACDSSSSPTDVPEAGADSGGGDDVAQPPIDAQSEDAGNVILDDGACSTYGGTHDAGPDVDADADADLGCYYVLPCGFSPDNPVQIAGCQVFTKNPGDAAPDASAIYCNLREGAGCTSGVYTPGPNGSVTLDCNDCFGGTGRRPRGLARPTPRPAKTALGAWLAKMAHDEAASVAAFERMRVELTHFGAPRSLVRAAERASRDEVRHARTMTSLARAHGGRVARARVRKPRSTRSLEAMALENAVEGCVNETFGALILACQAKRAPDPKLRAAFSRLASDELRHAALSWSLARWADRHLDARARRRVTAARTRAIASLKSSLTKASAPSDVGRPAASDTLALLDRLSPTLAQAA
jgi:hypothetical protein